MSEILQDQDPASAAMQSQDMTGGNPGEQEAAAASTVDEYLDAPKSYKKEYAEQFKTLSPEWRKYLTEREREVERGFSDFGNRLNGYKWLDNVLTPRQERLAKAGFAKPQDWIEALAKVDDAFAEDPQGTIKKLAEAYGVSLETNNNTEQNNPLLQKISRLEQNFSSLNGMIASQRQAEANQTINNFIEAKDENGNPKHPHFDSVKNVMGQLLNSRMAKDIEDAYAKAVWLVPEVQEKMISARQDAALKKKVEEAAKAKEAGFDPKGKAAAAKPELSTRDLLEQQFDAQGL